MDKVKTFLAKAGQLARELGDPELEMTEAEIAVALWGSHSFRRGADKRARAYCLWSTVSAWTSSIRSSVGGRLSTRGTCSCTTRSPPCRSAS